MAQGRSGYSTAQIMEMQRDAMRRVNEMQRMAQQKVGAPSNQPQQEPSPAPKQEEAPIEENKQHETPIMQQEEQTASNLPSQVELPDVPDKGFKGILDKLNLDEEKITLIILILLLMNEGADTKLLLALGYILLQ